MNGDGVLKTSIHQPMSDLRTRIAAAIDQRYNDEAIGHTYEVCLMAADAVIRELDLAAALCPEFFKGYNNGHDEGFIEGWEAANGELRKPTNLKTMRHQQVAKQMRDPDMIAADQEWQAQHPEDAE